MSDKKTDQTMGDFTFEIKPYKEKKGEEHMSEGQQAHFRMILEKWRDSLSNKMGATVSHLKDDSHQYADLNDRATQEEEFSLELRTRDREANLAAKINEALKALDEGDYGYCEECGVEIGIRRLEARPTATQCIDCKTLSEIKERQTGA